MIILVGHTYEKMQHTLSLLPESIPKFLVYNGKEDFPGALKVPNHPRGRDIHMYAEGVKHTNADRLICINDDVLYIDPEFFKIKDRDIAGVANQGTWWEIAGMGNLASWSRERLPLRFIRTSAFIITREYFNKLYKFSGPNCGKFEKNTINFTDNYKIIDPLYYYDSNVKEYWEEVWHTRNKKNS